MLKSLTHKFHKFQDMVRSSWEDQPDHTKVKPVSKFVLANQADTLSSAKDENKLSIKKVSQSATVNTYYQDSISSFNTTSFDDKISTINAPSRQKNASANPEAVSPTSKPATVTSLNIDLDTAKEIIKDNYQELAAKAGKDTQDFISQTKVQSDGTKNFLDQRLEQLSQRIDEELKKDNVNFDALQAMVLKIVMLHMRRTARVEHEYTSEQGLQIKLKAIEVKDSYTSWSGLAVAVTSATVSLVGGAAGLSPFAGSMIAPETVEILVKASQPLSNASTGINSVGGIYSAKDSSTKGHHEFHLRLMQSKEDNAKERKRSNGEVIKTVKSLIEEAFRNLHQLFTSFSSNGG